MAVRVGYCFALFSVLHLCFAETTKSPKAAEPTKSTPATSMINFNNLEVVDYLRSAALVVALIFTVMSDKRGRGTRRNANPWINAEVVGFFLAGMSMYFFPETILQYFSKNKLNVGHTIDFQMTGTILVGLAITTARSQNYIESDGFVHSNWLISRLAGSLFLFVFMLFSHIKGDNFRDQHFSFCIVAVFVWVLGNVYQRFFSNYGPVSSGNTMTSPNSIANKCLLIDTLLTIPMCVPFIMDPMFGYNQMTTISADSFNAYVVRQGMFLLIATSHQNFGALYYPEDAKKQLFFGHLMTMAMQLPVIVLWQWKHTFMNTTGLYFCLFFYFLSAAVNWIGYWNGKIKSK